MPVQRHHETPVAAVIAVILVVIVMVALPGAALAQTAASEPMTVEFNFGDDDDWLADLGVLRALMGTTECGRIDFATSERTLIVGGPDTPAACNQAWRVVNLVHGGPEGEAPLANDPIFHAGTTVTISTITPFPTSLGPDVPPFFIVVPLSGELTREDLADLESLTAYVGGVECGSVSTVDFDEPLAVPVGAAGAPDACRVEGAEVVLVYGSGGGFESEGGRLVVRPSVRLGYHYTLTNLAPEPVSTGPAAGEASDPASGPAPAAAGHGLADRALGNTGPAADSRTAIVVASVASTVLLLIVARRRMA